MAQWEIEEALREQEQRLRSEFRQHMQECLRNRKKLEKRLLEVEGRPRNTEPSPSGGGEQMKRLEERLAKLELSVRRALEPTFPRFDGLMSRLEERSCASTSSPVVISTSSSSKVTSPNTISSPAIYLAQWELNKELDAAVEEGRAVDVRRLLGAGAEFQKIRLSSNCTPLMEAALKCHSDVLLVLLENGADVHVVNARGSTALTCAAAKDLSGKCVVLLIGAGADVNCKGPDGNTPLHCAAHSGNYNAVLSLLDARANKKTLNNHQKAPSNYAKSDDIRRLLLYSNRADKMN